MKINDLLVSLLCMATLSASAYALEPSKDVNVQPNEKQKQECEKLVVDDKNSGIDEKTQSILERIGFGKSVSSSNAEIEKFFKTFEKYTKNGDTEKLKSLYSEDFVNNDGFDKKSYFDLITLVSDMYEDAQYTMEIKSIHRRGNYAYAYVDEYATATTTEKYNELTGKGVVTSSSSYLFQLRKIDGKWKITALDVQDEITTLAYGDAKSLDFEIKAPSKVKQGSKYTIEFDIKNKPKDSVMIASIVNDPIIYPQANKDEVFRTIKKNRSLERIVTANKDNCNEYATVSLGITKAGFAKGDNDIDLIKIYMTGMAFVMQRVNVENVLNHKVEQKSDKKAENGQAKN